MRLSFAVWILIAFCSTSVEAQSRSQKQVPPEEFASKEQELRFEHLKTLGENVVDWHCKTAKGSSDVQAELRTVIRRLAAKIAKQHSWRDSDYKLSVFVGKRGMPGRVLIEGRPWETGLSAWGKAVESAFDQKQLATIQAALSERQAFHLKHSADAHVAYLEELVGLSDDELKLLRDRLATHHGDKLLVRPLCVRNLQELHLLDDNAIRKTLGERTDRLLDKIYEKKKAVGFFATANVLVTKDWSAEERRDAIDLAIQQVHKTVASKQEKYVQLLGARYELNKKALNHLQLVMKGVRSRHSRNWREQLSRAVTQTEKSFDEFAGLGELDTLSASRRFNLGTLENDKLWQKTLAEVLADVRAAPRPVEANFTQKAIVGQMLIFFDRELWLRPEQREPFRKRIDAAIGVAATMKTEEDLANLIRRLASQFSAENGTLSSQQIQALKSIQSR